MEMPFPHKNIYGNGVPMRSRSTTPLMLRTSGFVVDVMFSHNGTNSDTGDVAKYSL